MPAIDNWYLALELAFEPTPESDPDVIEARVAEKVVYWSQHANDAGEGGKFTRWREKADQMRKDLRDPEIRHRMASEALELTFGRLDATLRQVSDNGKRPITSGNLQKIASRRGFSAAAAASRAAAIGITIAEGARDDPAEHQATFDEIYTKKPARYAMFEGFKADLGTAGATDLYHFLGLATAHRDDQGGSVLSDPRIATTDELRASGERLRKEFFRKTTTAEKVKANVGKYCETAFADNQTRREYDAYLEYLQLRLQVDSIVEDIEILHGGRCTSGVATDFVLGLNRFIKDKSKAAEFFAALCRLKGFEFDPESSSSYALEQREVCRCGVINIVVEGAKTCTRCGLALFRRCPKCQRESPNTFDFCPCGFDFLNIVRAGVACEQALIAVGQFDLEAAKHSLEQARRLFPAHPDIAGVAQSVQQLDSAMGRFLSAIDRAVTSLSFYQARTLMLETQNRYPRYRNPGLARHIDVQLERARTKLAEAKAQSDPVEVLRACREVYGICRDLPGLQELVSRHTDLPLDALSVNDVVARNVSVSQVNHRVAVRLDVPGEGESGILIAYRFDAFPTGPDDPQAIVREFKILELVHEGVLRLETAQKRLYYVAVFLKFAAAGRSFFSRGQYAKLDLASTIVLTYSLAKKRFSPSLVLELAADQPIDTVPELGLVYTVGRTPVYESSGQPLRTIPRHSATYPCSFEIKLSDKLPKNSYVKPFVHDDPVFQLRLATGASHKVS